jgi:hypothetical protein
MFQESGDFKARKEILALLKSPDKKSLERRSETN